MIVMTNSVRLLKVDVQFATEQISADKSDTQTDELGEAEEPPSARKLSEWANHAYAHLHQTPSEITIRLVDEAEIISLNSAYRGKPKATNVLSFPVDLDGIALLGDVVVCHPVMLQEAFAQNKTVNHHYAHIVTHGVLHLCGYDHENDADAEQMEALEINILAAQGIPNPYI